MKYTINSTSKLLKRFADVPVGELVRHRAGTPGWLKVSPTHVINITNNKPKMEHDLFKPDDLVVQLKAELVIYD